MQNIVCDKCQYAATPNSQDWYVLNHYWRCSKMQYFVYKSYIEWVRGDGWSKMITDIGSNYCDPIAMIGACAVFKASKYPIRVRELLERF